MDFPFVLTLYCRHFSECGRPLTRPSAIAESHQSKSAYCQLVHFLCRIPELNGEYTMSNTDWLGMITPEEIDMLRKAGTGGRVHPVTRLAFPETDRQVAINTETAARMIMGKEDTWLRSLRPRLLDTNDFTAASSALGEIRAHGALLETWCTVSPTPTVYGSNVRPEFEANAGDGPVVVEVHSRQLHEDELIDLEDHHTDLAERHAADVAKASSANTVKTVVTTGAIEVFPTGAPVPGKAGDTALTNTISRFASIKQNERQVDPAKPFVLWLDLQDLLVWGTSVSEELFRPLHTEAKDGQVGSGPFWFALYGRKGDPLLETRGYSYRGAAMLHDGRFFQTIKSHGGSTRLSGVVYSLPRATILMENPAAIHPLPDKFRASMLKAPFFRLDLSVLEWEAGLVQRTIDTDRQIVEAAVRALECFDPGASRKGG